MESDEKDNLIDPKDQADLATNDPEFEEIEESVSSFSPDLKDLRNKLKICTKEKSEYLAGWQRTKADYINLKNEFEKKRVDLLKFGNERIIYDLLTVLDSFQMAVADKVAWEKLPANWRQGMENIHNQLESVLRDYGLKRLEVLDHNFDPALHESIDMIETDNEDDDHKVLMVVKDGYELAGKVIRPAQVKIGKFNKN